ncbi:MAG: acetoacetate--CoA ligase [Saprospiraceae bacterium]
MIPSNDILWEPSVQDLESSRLREYRQWLQANGKYTPDDYESLWKWSVENIEDFWETIVSFFKVKLHSPYTSVLSGDRMPDVTWFDGATLNYAEHIFKGMSEQEVAILFCSEHGESRSVSIDDMWKEVATIRAYFLSHGVKPGDRIAGFLPNIPEATYAFLAAASIGAVWSCCSPDFGVSSVVSRFQQIDPVLLIAANGYYYNGKTYDRISEIKSIIEALPGLKDSLLIKYIHSDVVLDIAGVTNYDELEIQVETTPVFLAVPFSHPLWILFSSGTTGDPKAITHSHGGCLLEHLKYLAFHNDVHAGERFFWYTTTGWMMWNFLHGSMLLGATMVLYDGSPAFPNLNHLWKLAEVLKINHFGTSAPFLVACMKGQLNPGVEYDLSLMRSIGSTGSPLPSEAFDWVYDAIHERVWLCSMSGGTDVCTAFVGGTIEKKVVRGEIQARALGCSLYAFDDHQKPIIDSLGEMVITKPMPSMPIYFWNDPDKKRYRSSYFEDIPGVWRHGDWVKITSEGGIVIYGRSDATLNRHGIRIGTAEIYRVLNEIPAIDDSLIVNLEMEGGRHYMPLFVKLKNGFEGDDALRKTIASLLKLKCTPRHVPDEIIPVPDIPYTISGKKMEAPVKKILMGMKVDDSLNRDAMRNPESLEFFTHFVIPPERKS